MQEHALDSTYHSSTKIQVTIVWTLPSGHRYLLHADDKESSQQIRLSREGSAWDNAGVQELDG